MKISELPEPYKTLAEKRRGEELRGCIDPDNIEDAFYWADTPEGDDFWNYVWSAICPSDLPHIPELLLKEIGMTKSKLTKGTICVILQQVSDAHGGQVNLDSRIMQEKIADKILEVMK